MGKRNRREFSLKAMAEKFNGIVDDIFTRLPQSVNLKLPKLKKINDEKQQPAKIKLPKLKKVT